MKNKSHSVRMARVAVALAGVILVSGCGVGAAASGSAIVPVSAAAPDPGSSVPRSPSPPPVLGATQVKGPSGQHIQIRVHRLHMDANGYTYLGWSITNNANDKFSLTSLLEYPDYYAGNRTAKVWLVNRQRGEVYYSTKRPDGMCHCTDPYEDAYFVNPDETVRLYNTYFLPPDVEKVSVKIRGFDPVKNIPVK